MLYKKRAYEDVTATATQQSLPAVAAASGPCSTRSAPTRTSPPLPPSNPCRRWRRQAGHALQEARLRGRHRHCHPAIPAGGGGGKRAMLYKKRAYEDVTATATQQSLPA